METLRHFFSSLQICFIEEGEKEKSEKVKKEKEGKKGEKRR
jgi:hypothetical protein